MTSTSTSKNPKMILEVEKINLVYRIPLQRRTNFRDVFTSLVQDPMDTLFPNADYLHVAKDLSFTISEGERIGLLGVNGVGKTSLCRCIAGLFLPKSGKIKRYGPVRGVFNTALGIQPELTGRENAELLAHFIYPGTKDIDKIIDEAIEFSELGQFAEAPVKLYSNGMQTRLCLSVISARPTGLLILDEVFDGADMFFREKVSHRVLRLMKSSGGVLFVSHGMEQIKRVCTRVLVLHRGQIIFDGEPQEGIHFFENFDRGVKGTEGLFQFDGHQRI